ncbi:hypothetical protein HY990_03615 [Candidatus Micrarchaeota archaeon]|nr:hypothetical protein [Candidatus Micrarchaeota archaeon]
MQHSQPITVVLGVNLSKPLPLGIKPLQMPPPGTQFNSNDPKERAASWGKWLGHDYKDRKGPFGDSEFPNRLQNMLEVVRRTGEQLGQIGGRVSIFTHAELVVAANDQGIQFKDAFSPNAIVPETHGYRHRGPPDIAGERSSVEDLTKYAIGATGIIKTAADYLAEIEAAQGIIGRELGAINGTGASKVLLAPLGDRHIDSLSTWKTYQEGLTKLGIRGVLSKFRSGKEPISPELIQAQPISSGGLVLLTAAGLDVWKLCSITRMLLSGAADDNTVPREEVAAEYVQRVKDAAQIAQTTSQDLYLPLLFHAWAHGGETDPELRVIEAVVSYARSERIRVIDYRTMVEEVNST